MGGGTGDLHEEWQAWGAVTDHMQNSSSISGCPPAKSTPTRCSALPSHRKPRCRRGLQHLWSTTDSQASSPQSENCCELECDWRTRSTAQACCAQSGQRFTAASQRHSDCPRHTMKLHRMLWPSTSKDWSILAPTTQLEKPDKMLSRAAAVCPEERINSVSNVPQRDPTQFLTAIWVLALFPTSNFPLNHNTLCPSL